MQWHKVTGALLACGVMALTIGCAQRQPTTTVERAPRASGMYMPDRGSGETAASPAAKPSPQMATDFKSINRDLTPELMSTAQRPVDVSRALGYTNNANLRMFWDDMGRAFYTDHPSMLSPYPIVNASGTPH